MRFRQKSKMPPFACPRQVRGRHALGVGGIDKSRTGGNAQNGTSLQRENIFYPS
jgi:hypothetical protein